MAIIEVDEDNFNEVLEEEFNKKQIVIMKFGSELCDACQALEFELDEIDEKHENVSILTIDCNEASELAEQYDIQRVPTMMIYKDKDKLIYNNEGILLAVDIEKVIGLK